MYDVTDFINKHPGGSGPLLKIMGQDGTKYFGISCVIKEKAHPDINVDQELKSKKKGKLI